MIGCLSLGLNCQWGHPRPFRPAPNGHRPPETGSHLRLLHHVILQPARFDLWDIVIMPNRTGSQFQSTSVNVRLHTATWWFQWRRLESAKMTPMFRFLTSTMLPWCHCMQLLHHGSSYLYICFIDWDNLNESGCVFLLAVISNRDMWFLY